LLHDSKIRLSNIVLVSTTTSSRHRNTLFRSRFKIKLTNIRFMQQSTGIDQKTIERV